MRFLPYGDTAVLVEADEVGENLDVLGLRETVVRIDGVLDAVPAARTLLVEFDPDVTSNELITSTIVETAPPHRLASSGAVVEIPVRYDGADLEPVADEIGMSVEELIRRHAEPTYLVAFCGFVPGFAYLTGLDKALQVGRLPEPRIAVPPGSVGIAGEFTGVYPRVSPGGWRLLGRTPATLWDSSKQPPALLGPGTSVRFTIT